MVWACLLIAMVMGYDLSTQASFAAAPGNEERAWNVYTNARSASPSVFQKAGLLEVRYLRVSA
ncbi:MAG: hypothetical protein ABI988_11515 [Nitrospirota bacterium]